MSDLCMEHSAHERAIHVHDKRLNSHSEQLDEIIKTLATLQQIEAQNSKRIASLEDRTAVLESAPSETWAKLKLTIAASSVTFLLGLVAASLNIS